MPVITSQFRLNNVLAYASGSVLENLSILGLREPNYYTNVIGEHHGMAGLLLRKADIDALESVASLTLTIPFQTGSTGTITVPAMRMIRSQRVDKSKATVSSVAENSLYAVELADRKLTLIQQKNTTKQYNVISYGQYIDNIYQTESTNSGTAWTWATLLQDLWTECGLGTLPTLPFTLAGTPQNLHFLGVNAWRALHMCLEIFSLSTQYNLATNTFLIVELGDTQSPDVDALPGFVSYTGEPHYTAAWNTPATISIDFPNHYIQTGQEEDTSQANNWETNRVGTKYDYTTGVTGAAGVRFLHSASMQIVDFANEDEVGPQAIVDQIGAKWVQNNVQTRRHVVYPGIRNDVVTGSEIRAVTYRVSSEGSETEYVSGPSLVAADGRFSPDSWISLKENIFEVDLARKTKPTYPRLPNFIRITGPATTEDPGDELTPNGNGHYEGVVIRRDVNSVADKEVCFVHPVIASYDSDAKLRLGQIVYGRLSGSIVDTGDGIPVYTATASTTESEPGAVVAALNGDISPWDDTPGCQIVSGDIVACNGSGGEVGETIDIIFTNVPGKVPALESGDYVGAALTNTDSDPKKYVATTDYSKTGGDVSVVVALNGNLSPWPDTPGCQIVSGDIVACNGSGGEVGITVDVIFPNVPGKVPSIGSGDFVAASPTDLDASPTKYVVSSDYSKVDNPGTRPFELTSSLAGGSATVTFLDDDSTGTVVDRFELYSYGEVGDVGYAAFVIIAGQYEIIDFKCDDGLGGS